MFERFAGGFVEIFEAEGLQASLRGPHGKEHFCVTADGGRADVEEHFDYDSLVEGPFELQQADREILRLKEEIASLPKRVAAIEQKLAGTKAALDAAKAAIKTDERRLGGIPG